MDFYETVAAKRTIRDFENAPIDDAAIERIIAAGIKAPTNDHMRDWHFIVKAASLDIAPCRNTENKKIGKGRAQNKLRSIA